MAKKAAKEIKAAIKHRKFRKDDNDQNQDDAALVAANLDLDDLDALLDLTPSALAVMATQGGTMALAQIGVTNRSDLVNQVYDDAADYAAQRAAELVGKTYVNGVLVDNPDADWSITEATRNQLRDIIANAFAGKIAPSDVEDAIAQAGAFSADRATLIARTEISRANNHGALAGYIQARDGANISLKKAWSPDAEACDVCLGNEDDGAIDLEDEFSSGDAAPPAHPNCECAITPITAAAEANLDDEED